MTWTTSARVAQVAARIRFALLSLVALFLGHDAVYAAEHGIGDGFATAMNELGHGAYWGEFAAAAIAAAILLIAGSAFLIGRLQRQLVTRDAPTVTAMSPDARGAYLRELRSIWPRLLLVVVALFAIQENVETFFAHGDLPGVDVLFGGGVPLAVPVLALVTFALAAVGALVRWRIGVLSARLRAATLRDRAPLRAAAPAREWAAVHAAAPHRWILDRRDAGRAPPRALPA